MHRCGEECAVVCCSVCCSVSLCIVVCVAGSVVCVAPFEMDVHFIWYVKRCPTVWKVTYTSYQTVRRRVCCSVSLCVAVCEIDLHFICYMKKGCIALKVTDIL